MLKEVSQSKQVSNSIAAAKLSEGAHHLSSKLQGRIDTSVTSLPDDLFDTPAATYSSGPKDGDLGGVLYNQSGRLKFTATSGLESETHGSVETKDRSTPLQKIDL